MKLFLATLLSLALSTTCVDTNSKLLTFYVMSDTSNWVTGPTLITGGRAVAMTPNSALTANIPGAIWIWDSINSSNPSINQICNFMNEFYIPGTPRSVILDIAGDNSIRIWINGVNIGYDKPNGSYSASQQQKANVTPYVVSGMNVIQIEVTNIGNPGATSGPGVNPAGVMYKLAIVAAV